MDVLTFPPVITLTHPDDYRPITWHDWAVQDEEAPATVFHRPSKLLFRIDCPPARDWARVSLEAISARVIQVGAGARLPAMDELHRIGKDAITVFLLYAPVTLVHPSRPLPPPSDDPDGIPF